VLERRSSHNWRLIAGAGILLGLLTGLLAYIIVPPLLTYEQLAVWRFIGWTANSTGHVTQATFIFINNGTRTLTISNYWINGTALNSTDFMCVRGPRLDVPGSADVCVVSKSLIFGIGSSYNFTVGTTSGKRYSYLIQCDEASASPENLTIDSWDFVPGFGSDWPEYIGFRYRNNGNTPIIITNVALNGQPANTNLPLPQWTWPGFPPGRRGPLDSVMIYCDWRVGQTYLIEFETIVGNRYQLRLTAPAE